MDSIYSHYRTIVAESCLKVNELSFENSNKLNISDILSLSFIVEKPNNEKFGDLSTNIALISSKFFS